MSRVLGRVVLCCVLPLALVSACGGEETPPEVAPTAPTSSGTESGPTDGPTESTSPEPSGPALVLASATVHAPEGWKVDEDSTEINIDADAPGGATTFLSFYDYGPVPGLTYAENTKVARNNFSVPRARQTLTEVELDGARAYRLTGSGFGNRYVELGAVHQGVAVSLSFIVEPRDFSPAEQQELVDEVLATFEWN